MPYSKKKLYLTPDALWELAKQLAQKYESTDIIYADQDCLVWNNETQKYSLAKPWFKPDWNRDLLLSRNYFGSLVLCVAIL